MSSDTQILIRRKDNPSQQEGPFSVAEFIEGIDNRTIHFGDYAWKTGLPNWILAGSLALSMKPRADGAPLRQPPELVFERRVPTSESAQKELFRRLDGVRVSPHVPEECIEIVMPINIVLCSNPQQPGGRLWRKIVPEWTQLFAARIRFEQAGLIRPHPLRSFLGEKSLDGDLAEDEIALVACEELKRRAVMLGSDFLVQFAIRFEFVTDSGQPNRAVVPVVMASAMAGLSVEAAEGRRARAWNAEQEEANQGPAVSEAEAAAVKARMAELAERERQIEEREVFLMDAESRLMQKIEEQQVREVELEMLQDSLASRESEQPSPSDR